MNGIEHEQSQPNGADESQEQQAGTSGHGLTGERQPNKERVTTPYLTKYERARILGTRALQIRYVLFLRFGIRLPSDHVNPV